MRRMVNILLACALCVCVYGSVHAQPADSIAAPTGRRTMPADAGDGAFPLFGIFRNNYFSTGFSTAAPVSQYTADVKFQLSVALRIWRMTDTSEMLFTYTQRSFWDIYRESCPFRENDFNPGCGSRGDPCRVSVSCSAWSMSRTASTATGPVRGTMCRSGAYGLRTSVGGSA